MGSKQTSEVAVYSGARLGEYGFGGGHPFSRQRLGAFLAGVDRAQLRNKVTWAEPVSAERTDIERFHGDAYVRRVQEQSVRGEGYLDHGDTPAFPGVYEISATVVGSTLAALDRLLRGEARRAFVPIAGLHHARRDGAAGFCVFNDCGVAIEALHARHPELRVAYVDIDAHHGDGVYYAFEHDPRLGFVDVHEDGRYLYPGTGAASETGTGAAAGTKLNLPLPPDADDHSFLRAWAQAEEYLENFKPNLVLLQCGADSIGGDPLTHLRYTPAAHRHAAERLCRITQRYGDGKVLALGGGGYNLDNIGAAWGAVLGALIDTD